MRKTTLILILLMLLPLADVEAQCAMCRAALKSSTDNSAAEAINDGIIYLMAFPYILMGGIGYIVYRKFRKTAN